MESLPKTLAHAVFYPTILNCRAVARSEDEFTTGSLTNAKLVTRLILREARRDVLNFPEHATNDVIFLSRYLEKEYFKGVERELQQLTEALASTPDLSARVRMGIDNFQSFSWHNEFNDFVSRCNDNAGYNVLDVTTGQGANVSNNLLIAGNMVRIQPNDDNYVAMASFNAPATAVPYREDVLREMNKR